MLIQENIPINIHSVKLQVNKEARKARHKKNFSGLGSAAIALNGAYKSVLALPKLKKPSFLRKKKTTNTIISESHILKRALGFVAFFVLVTSFTPNIAFSDTEFAAYEAMSAPMLATNIIADDSGFMIPVNPQTNEADRSAMSDKIAHSVESGETLSTIAAMYGLKTNTLKWENNLSNSSILRVGTSLSVPPVDGVSHTVKSGQSLAKVATLYDIEEADIIRQNALDTETLTAGQGLFIPGGEQIAPPAPVISNTAYRSTGVATASPTRVALDANTAAPAVGKFLIYPTRGKITQGYYSWHRAVDIGDRSKPPIWAAAGGTVVKASEGSWGGGYGNHVIIDHGNGVQTLYAHLDYLTVANGQSVGQGEVIGRMGNTGRVYGVTGIHLHFEVRDNGVKAYPGNYW
ncbi:peptidoglycan DD-metalloendopeptidase family protein [Patescibacteria group bacterium]